MNTKVFNTDKFTEKVMALSQYDRSILENLYINPINKQKINRGAALLIKNYFNVYLDARARSNPLSYHHVYEFNKTGDKDSRLFQINITNAGESAVISYSFTAAKEPNDFGYEFPQKASVMEKGEPITITPKKNKYLKYQLSDGRFITSEKSIVQNPGGKDVQNSFGSTFSKFMNTQADIVLQKSRFFQKIEETYIIKRSLTVSRINSGMTSDAIARAKIDADNISSGVVSIYA